MTDYTQRIVQQAVEEGGLQFVPTDQVGLALAYCTIEQARSIARHAAEAAARRCAEIADEQAGRMDDAAAEASNGGDAHAYMAAAVGLQDCTTAIREEFGLNEEATE